MRKSRGPIVIRGSSKTETSVQAAERLKHLHVWMLRQDTTADKLKSHLASIDAETAAKCTIEQLKPRGDYASFKVGVLEPSFERFMSMESWPQGVCLKEWRNNFRRFSRPSDPPQRTKQDTK